MTDNHPNAGESHKFERLVFFSDAVFAIAITVLVLDLKPEGSTPGEFSLGLYANRLFGFFLSFAVIGVYWLSHHRLFGGLWREDTRLRLMNLAFLASIVFLPFPTSIIAQRQINNYAVIFYAISAAAVGSLLFLLTLAARRPHLMRPEETTEGTIVTTAVTLAPPVIFLASAVLAVAHPVTGIMLWWLVGPAVLITRWAARRIAHRIALRHSANATS